MIKKIYYYAKKTFKDFFFPLVYKTNQENSEHDLKEYYFIFDTNELLKGGSYEYDFDNNRIPKVKGHISDTDGNYFYQPQAIGQYALALYHDYLKKENKLYLAEFLKLADWYRNNFKVHKGIPYWESTEKKVLNIYGKDDRGQIISSMSQSRAISVLLRAYQVTLEKEYLELAEKALVAYKKEPEDGGFLDKSEEGDVFFEEPCQPRILNHLIFSMFGLYDYCRIKKFNTEYYELFLKSLSTIKKSLYLYDIDWWSLYDNYNINGIRRINPCTRHYHNIHIQQLHVLYSIDNDEIFDEYRCKWSQYDKSILKRIKMLFHKVRTVKEMGRI